MGGLSPPPSLYSYRYSDNYPYSPFYVPRRRLLLILVFELYPYDRPDRGLPLRFLFCFGEESTSKVEFTLISGRGFKSITARFARAVYLSYLCY